MKFQRKKQPEPETQVEDITKLTPETKKIRDSDLEGSGDIINPISFEDFLDAIAKDSWKNSPAIKHFTREINPRTNESNSKKPYRQFTIAAVLRGDFIHVGVAIPNYTQGDTFSRVEGAQRASGLAVAQYPVWRVRQKITSADALVDFVNNFGTYLCNSTEKWNATVRNLALLKQVNAEMQKIHSFVQKRKNKMEQVVKNFTEWK